MLGQLPLLIVGRVWRKLDNDGARATILVLMRESAKWWGLLAPDGGYLPDKVIDWVWLDKMDPDRFVQGTALGAGICPARLACHGRLLDRWEAP